MTGDLTVPLDTAQPEAPPMRLRLYVVGGTPNSERAINNWQAINREYLDGRAETEIIDVLQEPERLLADGVIVTPALIRVEPEPAVRMVGDLSHTERILQALGGQGTA